MGLSEYISKVGFVQRIILSKTQLSVPGPYEDPPDVSAPFENDRLKVVLLGTGLSSLLIYTVLNMMSIFVFHLSKMNKNIDKRADSKYWSISWVWSWARFRFGLVKKKIQKIFRICSAAILTSSAHVPFPFTRFHIRSNPGIVRILFSAILSDMISALFSLYLYVKNGEHNNTNFIRCRGFESKDLKNDGARENFNFSLKNWRKIWISFLAQPGRKLN